MGRISKTTKSAGKRTALAIGRSTGRLVKKTVKSGYATKRKRDGRDQRSS